MNNYINVDRKFSELSDDIEIDDDSFDVDSYLGISSGKTWDDLLKLNRVVILVRAGAGKTEDWSVYTISYLDELNYHQNRKKRWQTENTTNNLKRPLSMK